MSDPIESIREQILALLPRLRRFARTITRNVNDADDLVQLSIERALLRHEQWRSNSRFEGWMFGIMHAAWIDEVRDRQRRDRLFLPEADEHMGEARDAGQIRMMSVQTDMASLPEEQRMAVALVLIEGLSYKEAAEILEVSIETVTSRIARGREALQVSLGDVS